MIYDNVFASTYCFYRRFDRKRDPQFTSVSLMALSQALFTLMLISFIKLHFNIIPADFKLKPYFIAYQVLLLVLNYFYFNNKKTAQALGKYESKELFEKRIWGVVAYLSLFLPLGIIIFILKH